VLVNAVQLLPALRDLYSCLPETLYEEHPDKSVQDDPDERCARCGRVLYTVTRVVYEGDEGGGRKL
jgi:hypothetical protein